MAQSRGPVEPAHLPWHEVATIADLLVRSAHRTPHRRAVVFAAESLSCLDLLERARQVARGLAALGVRRGDHVGILLPNGLEFAEAFFGAAYLGGVVVPLNPRYRSHELSYAIASADIAVVLTSNFAGAYTDFAHMIESCAPELPASTNPASVALPEFPHLRSVVLLGGDVRAGFLARPEFNRLSEAVPPALVEDERQTIRVRDPSMILYTSGTTANPKGCILTHEAVTRGAVSRADDRLRTRDHDVVWSPGPLFHMGSLQWLIGAIGVGATFVSDTHFDPGRAIELIRRERPTIGWPLFPAIMTPILAHPTFDRADLASLRKMLLIGPEPLLLRVQRMLPQVELLTSCGMTEMAGVYALSGRDESVQSRARTQGRPLPGVRVRIVRPDDGAPVTPGEAGELLVQGPGMMEGYYNDPDSTAHAIDSAGWLHTGDLYRQAANGNLVFEGRIKDMLKVGGENVSALEIESFLHRHPEVVEAAVIGVPDERLDEVPMAFVEIRAGAAVTAEDIVSYCQGRIARYKVPRYIRFVAAGEWPMSTTKIDKIRLRQRAVRDVAR